MYHLVQNRKLCKNRIYGGFTFIFKKEQDERKTFIGTRQRSWEYEDGGNEQKAEKNEGVL
jgi:hypothetical protein